MKFNASSEQSFSEGFVGKFFLYSR